MNEIVFKGNIKENNKKILIASVITAFLIIITSFLTNFVQIYFALLYILCLPSIYVLLKFLEQKEIINNIALAFYDNYMEYKYLYNNFIIDYDNINSVKENINIILKGKILKKKVESKEIIINYKSNEDVYEKNKSNNEKELVITDIFYPIEEINIELSKHLNK